MTTFHCTLYMIDLSRPLAKRLEVYKQHKHRSTNPTKTAVMASEHCGVYQWTRTARAEERTGIQGYLSRGELDEGSPARLRIEEANEHTRSRIHGYYTNEFQDETMQPIVARLPSNRGFLAGWTLGQGAATALEMDIYQDVTDAAQAAHSIAENAAEREREYQEGWQAGLTANDQQEQVARYCETLRDLFASRHDPEHRNKGFRRRIQAAVNDLQDAREELESTLRDWSSHPGFKETYEPA